MDAGRLHPALTDLLRQEGWSGLTDAQEAALPPLQAGEHLLLVAPTGSGKTEAALLPVLSRILDERDHLQRRDRDWPVGFKCIYVTPLRALNRDLLHRLEHWCQALQITIGVRHGDTSQAERSRQSRKPPDLLVTTPETVQLLLYGDTLRRHLGTVRFMVLDEVHDLAAAERGAQLMVALERIEEVVAQPPTLRAAKAKARACPATPSAPPAGGFQRIGLSATVADPTAVARFMGGRRDVRVQVVRADRRIDLRVRWPQPTDAERAAAGRHSVPPDAVAQLRAVRDIVARHERVLVFHNTRDGAELLVSRSAMLDAEAGREPLLGLHHGSLSKEHREDVEDRFKRGDLKALVATSSLELGIDIGAIDHVVQVGSPRSIARMVQRLGRAGHRVGARSDGTLLATGAEDGMECMVVARATAAGALEPLRIRDAPLVVLANQLVALANEYRDLDPDWTRAVVQRAGPFLDLDDGMFQAAWEALLDVQTLFPSDERPDQIARSGRARRHFLDHISLIPDERTYRIIDEAAKRSIGTVDDAFVAAGLHPGALFVMAGQSWNVLEVDAESQKVRVAPAKEVGAVPQWSGSQLPVSAQVARDVAHLRGRIAAGDPQVPVEHATDPVTYEAVADPVRRQQEAGLVVPTERVASLESGRGFVVANVALGTRGNEALGRITQALLHQRAGAAVGMDFDAYRIHLDLPVAIGAPQIEELWQDLEPETLDVLLSMLLKDAPVLRHHLVHVAKHFGALPKDLDPNRFSKKKLEALLDHMALHEETLSRLIHDRMDLEAVTGFLHALQGGRVRIVHQAVGPLSHLGREETRRLLGPPRSDEALLAAVRERIQESEVMMVCTACRHRFDRIVADLPPRIRCRRCGSQQVACLRPWQVEETTLLRGDPAGLDQPQRRRRRNMLRNASLVASYGKTACLALVARGVGPDTAVRVLQKIPVPENAAFWRELLQAELTFARTSAYWGRPAP